MIVEYDPTKRDAILETRGLDMARAADVFVGPTMTVVDERRDYGEVRYISVGFLDRRMVVLVWTRRGAALRIISMRKANAREQEVFGPRFS